MKLAMKTAAKRKLQKAKQMGIQGKRKRLVKKIKKSCKAATNEVHEGVTYSKYAELHHDKEQKSTKTTEIPQRLTLPRKNLTRMSPSTLKQHAGGGTAKFCRLQLEKISMLMFIHAVI